MNTKDQLPEQIPDSDTLWLFLTKGMTRKEIQSLSAHDQKVYRERAAKNWAMIRREASDTHPASSPTQCNTN